MKIKSIITILSVAVITMTLTACGSVVPKHSEASIDLEDSNKVIKVLDDAKKITVKKAVFSFGDKWTVTADDVEVAEIRGQVVPVLGDTYNMFTKKGNLVGSEAEKIFNLLPGAVIYDEQNNPRGSMNQDVHVFLQKFTFSDEEGKPLAYAQQNLNFALDFDIVSVKDKKDIQYKVNKAFFSWGATLSVEKVSYEPKLSGLDAVWFAVIANELNEDDDE